MSRFQPHLDSDSDSDSELGTALLQRDSDNEESPSFGVLNSVQQQLDSEREPINSKLKVNGRKRSFEDFQAFKGKRSKKVSKNAPSESSSKKPVLRIREIPGLKTAKETSLYSDVRFDKAYGKADWSRVRKDYGFLDEYRKKEIKEMQDILNNPESRKQLLNYEVEDIKNKIQSLQLRLDTLRNRDIQNQILSSHKREQMRKVKSGDQVNPYFLKKSEQQKMIQKAKFELMKPQQREKVMERKRKRRLGKEFKQLEFRNPRS